MLIILPPFTYTYAYAYDLLIARADRAVKFLDVCLQNCGLVNLRRDRTNPLSTVGNGPAAGENAPPFLTVDIAMAIAKRGGAQAVLNRAFSVECEQQYGWRGADINGDEGDQPARRRKRYAELPLLAGGGC